MKLRVVTIWRANTETMSENLLGKKVRSKDKTGVIVRIYEVLRSLKDSQRVNIRWNDDTVSTNVRLTDLEILG
jgi:hypothetical protein